MNNQEKKFFNEFAEDAFIEIDENLQKIKSELLQLEKFIGKKNISKKILNNMLIPFHTIKGISGMVGLSEIQNISHAVEHFIKHLIESGITLERKAVDGIYDSVKIIESLLVVYREDKTNLLPSYKQEMDRLIDLMFKLCEKSSETKPIENILETVNLNIPKDVEEFIKDYLGKDKIIYALNFKPSAEMFSKGININKIREYLANFCDIIHSRPIKDEFGAVCFELILATESELENDEFLKEAQVKLARYYSPLKKVEVEEQPKEKVEETKVVTDYQKFSFSNVVRIELSRIDDLINMLGDLVITRSKFDLALKNLSSKMDNAVYRTFAEINLLLERKIRDLREGIMRTRLVPMNDLFERMKFVIHDLVRQNNKSIELELSGKETEIDKYVVEKMFDPLLHLVRNSVSHGIESPEERVQLGKSPNGKISISAYASGDSVVIEITDDGRGIDKTKVVEKAVKLGLIKSSTEISDNELLNIICSPGFSTRDEADMASGRGVGMTSVKKVVDELGGRIELYTEKNKGTKFTIYLPLTLAIVDAMIVEVENQLFAIPQPNISEIIDVEKSMIKVTESFYFIDYRTQLLPLIFLKEFFKKQASENDLKRYFIVIVDTTFGKAGLVVDKIKTKREIVVRSLNDPLVRIDGISGATELGDGKAVLILDCPGIVGSYVSMTKNLKEKIK